MDGSILAVSLTSVLASPSLSAFDPEIIEYLLNAAEIGALKGIHKDDDNER